MRQIVSVLATVGLCLFATPLAHAQIAVGARVQMTQDAAVRPTPGNTVFTLQPIGAQGVITAGPSCCTWNLTWWQINFDSGVDGWVTADRLQPVPAYPGAVAAPQVTRREVAEWQVAWTLQGGTPSLTVVELERGPTAAGPWTPLATTAAGATVYNDRAVVTGQPYCYRMRGRIGTTTLPFVTAAPCPTP